MSKFLDNSILYVRREPLTRGYTSSGRYFGVPSNLWRVEDDFGECEYIRAKNKSMAIDIVKAMFQTCIVRR